MRAIYLCVVATCLFTLVPSAVDGARILVLLGFSGKSHNIGMGELTSELALKGHEITIVTPFAIKNPPGKYRVIDMPITRKVIEDMDQMTLANASVFQKIKFLWSLSADNCQSMVKSPNVMDLLQEKFDIIIISTFFNDCFIPFAHYNKAHLILFSPAALFSWVSSNLGNPEPISYVPNAFLPFSHSMSFMQRFINMLVYYTLEIMRRVILLPCANEAAKELFGPDTPSVIELERNASLVLVNTHVSMNYPRPLQPNFIEVGGMHIRPNNQLLPKDLQEFMDEAKDGVIYFSMGSVVKPETFPPEMIQAFVKTFQILPQRVIWKWNLDLLHEQPSNVKLGKWLPQQAILAHPNCRLFITHGGLLSTQEASYHGVPLVGIPVFGDQQLNVKQSELIGFAVGLDFHNVTEVSFLEAIQRVLYIPSYSEKAKQLQKRVRDQPQSPMDRAVFWIEYVLRHDGAPHLRSAATRLTWYQLYLLDVTAVILVLVVMIFLVLKLFIKLAFGTGKSKQLPQTHQSKKQQ